MQPRTIGAILELAEASWFSRVGIKDAETAVVLSTWTEAIEHCRSHEWELLCTKAADRFYECIAERSRERWMLWNDVVREIKEFTDPLVERKIAAVVREHDLPEIFADRVRADVALFCIEIEYADVCRPGFFSANAHWYFKGHFPCGWRGSSSKGQLVIY